MIQNKKTKTNRNQQSPAFDVVNRSYVEEVVRHDGGILELATEIRKNLGFKVGAAFQREYDDSVIYVTDIEEFKELQTDYFKNPEFKINPDYARTITYTNVRRENWNEHARNSIYGENAEKYGFKLEQYEPNELLIVNDPVKRKQDFISPSSDPEEEEDWHKIYFQTSTELTVQRISQLKTKHTNVFIDDKEVVYDYYKVGVIYANHFENFIDYSEQVGDCEQVSHMAKRTTGIFDLKLISNENRDQWKLVNKRLQKGASETDKRDPYTRSARWKRYFEHNELFDNVDYGYAMTSHKAQGSTFKNVFVDARDILNTNWDFFNRNRSLYVAVTRASDKLFILLPES